MIIWHFSETCKYNFNSRDEVVQAAKDLVSRGIVLCARCKGILKLHSSYRRQILDEEGKREYGWVAQCHCKACKVYPALIPDFIMAHKHYKAEVIESVIAEAEAGKIIEYLDGCSADVSTMRRWVRQFKERGAQAVGFLCSILLTLYERHVSVLELRNRTLLKQLARLLREYKISKSTGTVGGVNVILTTQNCGFL